MQTGCRMREILVKIWNDYCKKKIKNAQKMEKLVEGRTGRVEGSPNVKEMNIRHMEKRWYWMKTDKFNQK